MMNQVIELSGREQSLKNVGHVSYLLHTIVAISAVIPGVQASILLLAIAIIIDLIKKDDAAGSWQASHFRWRIRTVVWVSIWYVVTLPLWLLFFIPGMVAWTIISIWFLYRIVRGWSNLSSNRPMEP